MTEEKLPKELPLISDEEIDRAKDIILKVGRSVGMIQVNRVMANTQRSVDQLLYDALWAENERLKVELQDKQEGFQFYYNLVDSQKAELAKVRQENEGLKLSLSEAQNAAVKLAEELGLSRHEVAILKKLKSGGA